MNRSQVQPEAIVFTEAVDAQKKKRLQHHFMRMREFAAQWRGREINFKKDGLTFSFQNATDAVSWALDVQNRIRSGNLTLPENERIQHRIAIYLKDEAMVEASRNKTDAGGICISQFVYDAVRKKFNIQANVLVEDEKNRIYQISIHAPQSEESDFDFENQECRTRKHMIRFIILIIICECIFLIAWMYFKKTRTPPIEPIPTVLPTHE